MKKFLYVVMFVVTAAGFVLAVIERDVSESLWIFTCGVWITICIMQNIRHEDEREIW